MNTLQIIKNQIEKAARLRDAQINHTSYRGVEYDTRCVENKESHGTFCYRGHAYVKWLSEVNLLLDLLSRVATLLFLWYHISWVYTSYG